MARMLDLADIQGNVLRAYGLPKARYICLNVRDSAQGRVAGRAFVDAIRSKITTALPWQSSQRYPTSPLGGPLPPKPQVTFNIAFTFWGLAAVGVPTTTLRSMPTEFIDGMGARAQILGDDFLSPGTLDSWDPVWRGADAARRVHLLVALNAQMNADGTAVAALQRATEWIWQLCAASDGGVTALAGHGGSGDQRYQDASALLAPDAQGTLRATPKEHFGFTDGFGDPVFDGQYPEEAERTEAIGGGKILPNQSWAPLATGEFLLGYPDEAQEVPPASMPLELTRNGTFMAYRKLHQNVGSFQTYLEGTARRYAQVNAVADVQQARAIVQAKIVGRWSDGVPLMAAPTFEAWKAFQERERNARASGDQSAVAAIERAYVDFKYRTDPTGGTCPMTSHMRRANTRDGLDPTGSAADPAAWNGSVLDNRRRILRRGLPYGISDPQAPADGGDHGIIFMALCASLFRQFEFVQQQWMQYGLDFKAGNDTCPLIGNHGPASKFVIPGDARTGTQPVIGDRLPQFVEVRGGDYLFVPSLSALRMIGVGTIDPT
jgi:deferrochelatase/peroxidase EfeB